MEEVLIIVHDPEKVQYAATLAREMTEKLCGQNVKVTLYAEGNEASAALPGAELKILEVKAAGGEVIACVHEIKDEEMLRKITTVMHGCLTDIERRQKAGSDVMRV